MNLPEPYKSLDAVLPFLDHGWFNGRDALREICDRVQPRRIVEVGTWLGKSAIFLASRLPGDGGTLFCVDTWEGSPEHHNDPESARLLPNLYQQFLSNIVRADLADLVVPIRLASVDAARLFTETNTEPVDLVYIDAEHSFDSCLADCRAWWPLVRDGGTICGDDIAWEGVYRAVNTFAREKDARPILGSVVWEIHKGD